MFSVEIQESQINNNIAIDHRVRKKIVDNRQRMLFPRLGGYIFKNFQITRR